jgi:hypothetical protein
MPGRDGCRHDCLRDCCWYEIHPLARFCTSRSETCECSDRRSRDAYIGDLGSSPLSDLGVTLAAHGGTPLYMAPEMYNEVGCTVAVDVYSFSLILYELLVGHSVSPAAIGQATLVRQVVTGNRPRLPQSVCEPVRGFFERGWSANVSDRDSFDSTFESLWKIWFKITPDVDSAKVTWFLSLVGEHPPTGAAGRMARLKFRTVQGNLYELMVNGDATVLSLKQQLEAVHGLPADRIMLVWSAKVLDDRRPVRALQGPSECHIVVPCRGTTHTAPPAVRTPPPISLPSSPVGTPDEWRTGSPGNADPPYFQKLVESLILCGFDRSQSKRALRSAAYNVEAAAAFLASLSRSPKPALSSGSSSSQGAGQSCQGGGSTDDPADFQDRVESLVSCGFDRSQSEQALRNSKYDIEDAVLLLTDPSPDPSHALGRSPESPRAPSHEPLLE